MPGCVRRWGGSLLNCDSLASQRTVCTNGKSAQLRQLEQAQTTDSLQPPQSQLQVDRPKSTSTGSCRRRDTSLPCTAQRSDRVTRRRVVRAGRCRASACPCADEASAARSVKEEKSVTNHRLTVHFARAPKGSERVCASHSKPCGGPTSGGGCEGEIQRKSFERSETQRSMGWLRESRSASDQTWLQMIEFTSWARW